MLRYAAAAAMLLGCCAARSEDTGFYAGAGIGQSSVSDDEFGFSVDAKGTAFKLFGGYQLNKNIAFEASYIDLGEPDDESNGVEFSLDATAFQGSIRAIWPFSDSVSGFAKAGIVFWDSTATATDGVDFATVEDSGNDFSWGAGLEFGSQRIKGRVEYEGANITGTDFKLISLSVAWLFK